MAATAVVSFANSASSFVDRLNASTAVRVWPDNGKAWARLGARELAKIEDMQSALSATGGVRTPVDTHLLETYSRRALEVDGLNAIALRNLAFAAALSGDAVLSQALSEQAYRTSKRDVANLLLLGRGYLVGNRLAPALVRLDQALRVSPELRPQIFPLFAQALSDPTFKREFAPYLTAENEWLAEFFQFALQAGLSPRLIGSLIVEVDNIPELPGRDVEEIAPLYLVPKGEIAIARKIAERLPTDKRPAANGGVSDPTFDRADIVEPFGWVFNDSPDVSSIRPAAPGAPLTISTPAGVSGVLARQMLVLSPGRYRLRFDGDLGTNAGWSLTCTPGGAVLIGSSVAAAIDFVVPVQGCDGQWLRLNAAALGAINIEMRSVQVTSR